MRPERILIGKIGRAMLLSPHRWGPKGGDGEAPMLLERIARAHPDVEFVVGGRHRDGEKVELPPNVVLPPMPKMHTRNTYVRDEEGVQHRVFDGDAQPWEPLAAMTKEILLEKPDRTRVLMILGQHGGANYPIPKMSDRSKLTEPRDECMMYTGPVTLAINAWREDDPLNREEVWLWPDPRNYVKARELKWPLKYPVLGPWRMSRTGKHERFGDPRTPAECRFPEVTAKNGVWEALHHYSAAGIELLGFDRSWEPEREFSERVPFRMLTNWTQPTAREDRAMVLAEWLPADAELRGDWKKLAREPKRPQLPCPVLPPIKPTECAEYLGGACSTFLTATHSGCGWPTLKAWEAFALGTVCFFHSGADDQGHIVPTQAMLDAGAWEDEPDLRNLALWLRPPSPRALHERIRHVAGSRQTYEALRDAQLTLVRRALEKDEGFRVIEERLGLREPAGAAA